MKRLTYTLKTNQYHDDIILDGYQASEHFGVHKNNRGWTLTHLASGQRVAFGKTRKSCQELAQALEPYVVEAHAKVEAQGSLEALFDDSELLKTFQDAFMTEETRAIIAAHKKANG